MEFWNRIFGKKNKPEKDLKTMIEEINRLSVPQEMPEKIIKLQDALSLIRRKSNPSLWASLKIKLGNSLCQNPKGDRGSNIEQAIRHYNQASKVYTRRDFPVEWAVIQNNLGNAYVDSIQEDIANNIEKGIEYYNRALEVYRYHFFPEDWARVQDNLGTAHFVRILGDRDENIEKAIKLYYDALQTRIKRKFPVDYATTLNNFGNALADRIYGDRAENIETAIQYYNQALIIRTENDSPVDWAMVQNNLGLVYIDRILGNIAENIEKSLEHHKQALKVYTYQDFPVDWAETRENLATGYSKRILGDRTENIEKAIIHCHNALQIYKLESMPYKFRKICALLGDLYFDIGRWREALESYRSAIKTGNLLYRSCLSAESKMIEAEEHFYICRNAAFAACRLGLTREALLILEGGKTRLQKEALRLKVKEPEGIPIDKWLKKVIQKYTSAFQKELSISDILSLTDKETALLTFCITDKGSIGFVVSESSGVQSVDIPDFKTEDLNSLLFKTDERGYIKEGWIGDYFNCLEVFWTGFHEPTLQTWQKTINNVLYVIGTELFRPILTKLPPQTKRLILLPSGSLFLLPLHAVPISNSQLLCQRFCISYAPSVQLLREMKSRARTVKGKGFYTVINPEEDSVLVFLGLASQNISKFFNSSQVNLGKTATKSTVLGEIYGREYIHFSCHGRYNWTDPLQSGLYLAEGQTLILEDLQNEMLDMSSARLVTLAGCETGIIDIINNIPDKFVGLLAGFMCAGAPCVVSSLWTVPDISTALLMERFYSNHIVEGMDVPMALQDAQLWVRDLTSSQVVDYVEKCYLSGNWEGISKEIIEQHREYYFKFSEEFPNEKPFKDLFYWAAFTVNGA